MTDDAAIAHLVMIIVMKDVVILLVPGPMLSSLTFKFSSCPVTVHALHTCQQFSARRVPAVGWHYCFCNTHTLTLDRSPYMDKQGTH
jgi:hypothetical protein